MLQRLRANDATREITVIAITSFAMTGDRQCLLAAGCNVYIEKSVEPSELIKAINSALTEDVPQPATDKEKQTQVIKKHRTGT